MTSLSRKKKEKKVQLNLVTTDFLQPQLHPTVRKKWLQSNTNKK